MLKYESENFDGLLVEFMESLLKPFRHTKPKLSSYNVKIVWSTVYLNNTKRQSFAYGFITDSKYVVCICTTAEDLMKFNDLCKQEGIKL